jgi:hypothetical protein
VAIQTFTAGSFGIRLLMAGVLVILTFNPTEFSYLHWLYRSYEGESLGAAHALTGVIVVAGWLFLFRASYRSLGMLGLLLGAAFFGTLVWFLISIGVLTVNSRNILTWIALICLSGLLALGVSWSHIRRRISGQLDVDRIDERP